MSPTADNLWHLQYRAHNAAVAPSLQQNFVKVSVIRARVSRVSAFISVVTLAVSCFFTNSATWANGCSGNTVISSNIPLTATQKNALQLCSLTVDNGTSISTSAIAAYGIHNTGTITTLNNNGSISTTGIDAHGIYNDGPSTITTLNNNNSISTTGFMAYGVNNSGLSTITTLNNNGSISATGDRAYGIYNSTSTITTLNNTGTISATGQFIVDRVFKTTFARGLSYGPSKGLSKNDRIKETQGAYG